MAYHAQNIVRLTALICHCEERSAAAIPSGLCARNRAGIAALLRSAQRQWGAEGAL
jgi:hypothetical protein